MKLIDEKTRYFSSQEDLLFSDYRYLENFC